MKAKFIAIFLSFGLGCFTNQSFAYNESLFGESNNTARTEPAIKIDAKPIIKSSTVKPNISTNVEKTVFSETKTNTTAQVNNNKIILVPIESDTPKTKMRLPSEFENIPPLTKWVDYNQYLKEQKQNKKETKPQPTNELIQKANKDPSKYVDNFFDYNKQTKSEDNQIKSGVGQLLSEYGVNTSVNNKKVQPETSMNSLAQRYVPLPRAIDNYVIPESQLGKQVYIRIFKQEHSLELYLKQGESYQLANIYDICAFYGGLGPKKRSGDNKSPEGFYKAEKTSLQPNSSYYKAINIGFPNDYDRQHGYTGQYLMIHGGCKSIGCYAMTNDYIKEIYKFVVAAFDNGQSEINMDIYPFKMTESNLNKYKTSDNYSFWKQLQPGYLYFEKYKKPPVVNVINGKYVIENSQGLVDKTTASSTSNKPFLKK